MIDEPLRGIDDVFAARTAQRAAGRKNRSVRVSRTIDAGVVTDAGVEAAPNVRLTVWDRFEWIELFIAVQFLWGALIFIPGAQHTAVISARCRISRAWACSPCMRCAACASLCRVAAA